MFAYRRIAFAYAMGLIAECVNRVIPIILIHFVARRLGAGQFGYAQFGMQLCDVAIFYVIAGFHVIGAIDVGKVRFDPGKVGRIVSEIVSLKFVHALAAFLALYVMTTYIPTYQIFKPLVLSLSFILFSTAIDLSFVNIGTQRSFALSIINVFTKLASLIAIVIFVKTPEDAILFAILSFFSNAMVSIVVLTTNWNLFRWTMPSLSGLWIRIQSSFPYAITALLLMFFDRFDLFLVEFWTNLEKTGIYASASRVSLSINNIMSALGAVFFAEMVSLNSEESLAKHIELTLSALASFIIPIAVGGAFVSSLLLGWLAGEEFTSGGPVLSILLWACLAQLAITVFGQLVMQVKSMNRSFNILLSTSIVLAILAGSTMVRDQGIHGIAMGVMLAKIIAGSLCVYLVRDKLRGISFRFLLAPIFASLMMAGILYLLSLQNLASMLGIGIITYAFCYVVLARKQLLKIVNYFRAQKNASQSL